MPSNPYDEVVAKTTDENLTSENWELILNLCDKVNDEGESGARAVMAALLKRLAHRSPTVQLYSLSLVEALSKNCGEPLHRELASRSFTQGLEKLITDRNTHEKVKRRGLYLVSLWTGEFESNPQLGLMEELYESLKAKDYNFEQIKEPQPPVMDEDEIRRKEEEELQKVLEMSLRDKGGRGAPTWEPSGSSSGTSRPGPSASSTSPYVSETARSPSHRTQESSIKHVPQPSVSQATSPVRGTTSSSSSIKSASSLNNITRVRALHSFEPTVAGELGFEKGDIIKVTDRAYENWWRGQLKGRTGIFPVNYVEPLPDVTTDELAREAEQEASVFAQAANIDKLVDMLRSFDPSQDNLADNDDIQELYRSSMALRPKIVKLIDKYSQKRAELVAMNENFVKARAVFDQIMEESLARHTGVYETRQQGYHPESRPYGWDKGYEQPGGYGGYGSTPAPYQASQPPYQSQPYPTQSEPPYVYHNRRATIYGGPHQPQVYSPGEQYAPNSQPYGQPPDQAVPGYSSPNVQSPPPSMVQPQNQPFPQPQLQPQPQAQPQAQSQPQLQSQAQTQPQPQYQPQPQSQAQAQPQPQYQPPQPQYQPQQQPQASVLSQSQSQPQPLGPHQNQAQAQPSAQVQVQAQPQGPPSQHQTQPQQSPQQQLPSGPPYPFDPSIQYPDPNVQAWAQYYSQGGTDPAGAVYFISVPGIPDASGSQQSHETVSGTAAVTNTNASANGTTIGGLESQMQNLSVSSNSNVAQQQQQPDHEPKRQSSLHSSSSVMPSYEASGAVMAGDAANVYPGSGGENIAVGAVSDPSLQQLARTPYSYGAPTPYYTGGAPLQHATSN